ncbi:DUF2939 domain-containing protein [Burkholderia cepacia]|uniref:DUF2939 domain-containing protein n=1 Tax=Burkholderia cepacia TaxID=292 RepID=UPI0022AAFDCA|nr:hypothetical protein [Burkholderia cepacia]
MRESLRAQFMTMMQANMAHSPAMNDIAFAGPGMMMAVGFANQVIDTVVTPARIAQRIPEHRSLKMCILLTISEVSAPRVRSMRFSPGFAMTIVAATMLSACATAFSPPSITTTVAVTSPPPVDKALRDGGSSTDLSVIGQPASPFRTLLSVRECAAGKCAAGIAMPTLAVTVQRVSEGQAAIRFSVSGEIGSSQTLKSQTGNAASEVTMSIPTGATPINDRFAVDRVATIKVGEFRHVALPHGIRAYVCVAIPNAKGMTDGSCDFSRVQTTKGAELGISAL